MTHRSLVFFLLGSASLLAQGETKVARPFPSPTSTKTAPAPEPAPSIATGGDHVTATLPPPRRDATAPTSPVPPQPEGIAFDEQPGCVWATSPRWKASFDRDGATFVPFLGSEAPRDLPVRFALRSVAVGGERQPAASGELQRTGNTVAIARPGVREEYAASDAGIEQRFVFASLPRRGEIVVDIGLTGDFAVQPEGAGFRLVNELGVVTYGQAKTIDADGDRCELSTEWTGSSLAIHVPAGFAAKATLPLVIDPLIGSLTTVATHAAVLGSDLAYDATLHRYVVCWEYQYSQTDTDVRLQQLDDAMQPVGPQIVVDATLDAWRKPRVANLNLYDRFLVVAEGAAPGQNSRLALRVFDGSTATMGAQSTPPFPLSSSVSSPDVGGDPSLSGPTYFTVVFEYEFSLTDHDLLYAQFDQNGVPRNTWNAIDVSNDYEHSPRISKCDGQGPSATQTWAVVYRRDQGQVGQTRAMFLAWDGQVLTQNMPLTGFDSPSGPTGLDVSSPTDGTRKYLVVDTKVDPQTSHRFLRGTAVTSAGTILAADQQLSFTNDPDGEPAVDCDGARFCLTFVENQAVPVVHATTVDLVGSQLLRRDTASVMAFPGIGNDGVVARHSGGAGTNGDRDYGLVLHVGPGGGVFAHRYLGMAPGGFGTRAFGCGPLTWSAQGNGAIGETIALQLANTAGWAGWVFGAVVDVPLGFCPGCRQGSSADVVLPGATLQWTIPLDTGLVGVTFAFQGFDFGAGTCLGSIALGNTADLTIR
ncbi:MAG: hypothetical protein FJ265_18830 [Planctomycetes bacterium]|nr:hypothetical protein [Planctomycetota bacterium]